MSWPVHSERVVGSQSTTIRIGTASSGSTNAAYTVLCTRELLFLTSDRQGPHKGYVLPFQVIGLSFSHEPYVLCFNTRVR